MNNDFKIDVKSNSQRWKAEEHKDQKSKILIKIRDVINESHNSLGNDFALADSDTISLDSHKFNDDFSSDLTDNDQDPFGQRNGIEKTNKIEEVRKKSSVHY